MPLNMPTHGHGQGYADANFLIPELLSYVIARKGPYFADEGDFSAAGAAHMQYKDDVPNGHVQSPPSAASITDVSSPSPRAR